MNEEFNGNYINNIRGKSNEPICDLLAMFE